MVHHLCYLILSRHRECIVVGPARSGAASGPNSSVGFVGTLPRAGLPSSRCSLGGGGLAGPQPRWPWRPSACTLRVARGQAFCAQEGGEGREGVTGFGWTWLRFRIWENHIWEPFAEAGTDWGNSAAKSQKSKMPMWMFFNRFQPGKLIRTGAFKSHKAQELVSHILACAWTQSRKQWN